MSDGKCEQCDDSLVVLWAWGSVLCALRKSRTLEIQWMDLLSCCIPRGLLVLIEQLYSCVLLASWSREFHPTVPRYSIVRLNLLYLLLVGLTRRLVRYSSSSS